MRGATGSGANFINLGHSQKFSQRRTRHAMGTIVRDARILDLLHCRLHIFVILIMHASSQAGFSHFRKAFRQKRRVDARETLRIRAKGRELKCSHARFRLFGNAYGTFQRINRAIEREIDEGLFTGMCDLALRRRCRANQIAFIIRHIDNGGNATSCGCAGRPDEIFLVFLRQRMHLCINCARHDERFAKQMPLLGCRRRSGAKLDDLAITHRNIAAIHNAVRQHYGSL